MYLTKSVVWGAVALVLARGIVLVGYDMSKRAQLLPRHADRAETEAILADKKKVLWPLWNWSTQSELFRTSIVLGVIAMLVSLMPNMPRYFHSEVHSVNMHWASLPLRRFWFRPEV